MKQGGGFAETPEDSLLRDAVFDEFGVGTPGNKPKFLGKSVLSFYFSHLMCL